MKLFTRSNKNGGPSAAEQEKAAVKAAMAQAVAEYGAQGAAAYEDEAVYEVEESPLVRLANTFIQQAVRERASDLFFEPDRKNVRIRTRIDGILHETYQAPKYIQMPLTERYKLMADMDSTEHRLPQQGLIGIRYEGNDYNLHVHCLPTVYGEKIVIRFFDHSSVQVGLNRLGFTSEVQTQLEELAQLPSGLLLVTGPNGSGKSTTLYALLDKLNTPDKNVISIEEMIKFRLEGVTQVQANRKAGLTVASALRAAMNGRPDVLLVGAADDPETLQLALSAAEAGSLVLAGMKGQSAAATLLRLTEMSIAPARIGRNVLGILAQRLACKVCPDCKERYEVGASELKRLGFTQEDPAQKVEIARGEGCEKCRQTGYYGRLGVFELLRMDSHTAGLLERHASLPDIKEAAKANGMHELREDGLLKILEGITTPDEVSAFSGAGF